MKNNLRWPSSNSECDFITCYERVKLFSKIINQIIYNSKKTPESVYETGSHFSQIVQNYRELTLCIQSNDATLKQGQMCEMNSTDHLSRDSLSELRHAAKVLQDEMKQIKEGKEFLEYKTSVTKGTLFGLNEVNKLTMIACKVGKKASSLLRKFGSLKHDVLRKEAKYVEIRKPLSESKRYVKQVQKMEAAERKFEESHEMFNRYYDNLMNNQLFTTGCILDKFFKTNLVYLANVLQIIACVVPNGINTLEMMVRNSCALSQRMSLEAWQPQGTLTSDSDNFKASIARGTGGRGGPDPGFSQLSHPSVHNFTSYCETHIEEESPYPSTPRTVGVNRANIGLVVIDVSNEPTPRQPNYTPGLPDGAPDAHSSNSVFLDPRLRRAAEVPLPTSGDVNQAFSSRSPKVEPSERGSLPASEVLRRVIPSSENLHREPFCTSDMSAGGTHEHGYSFPSSVDATRSQKPFLGIAAGNSTPKMPHVSAPPDDNTVSTLSGSARPAS